MDVELLLVSSPDSVFEILQKNLSADIRLERVTMPLYRIGYLNQEFIIAIAGGRRNGPKDDQYFVEIGAEGKDKTILTAMGFCRLITLVEYNQPDSNVMLQEIIYGETPTIEKFKNAFSAAKNDGCSRIFFFTEIDGPAHTEIMRYLVQEAGA